MELEVGSLVEEVEQEVEVDRGPLKTAGLTVHTVHGFFGLEFLPFRAPGPPPGKVGVDARGGPNHRMGSFSRIGAPFFGHQMVRAGRSNDPTDSTEDRGSAQVFIMHLRTSIFFDDPPCWSMVNP